MKLLSKDKILGSLGGNAVETALGFLIVTFVTRNYEQSEAGIYFVVLAIVSILNNLKEGFLQNGFVKFLVEKNFSKAVVRTGIAISLFGEILKVFFFVLIAAFYVHLQTFILSYCIYTLTFSHYRLLLFIHKSRIDVHEIVKGNLMIFIVSLIGICFIYSFQLSVESIFIAVGLGNLMALLSIRTNRAILIENFFKPYDRLMLKDMIQFGKYGFFKEVAGSVAHQAGIFVSAYFLSLEATSILGLATRYTILISIPGTSLAGMLYPMILIQSGERSAMKQVANDGIGKMYALLVPFSLLLMLVSPFLINFLHGVEYYMATYFLGLKIVASVFLIPLGSGFSSLMNAINKPGEITRLMLISSFSNVLICIVLIYFLGLWGAAIAPLLTEIIGGLIMSRRLKKLLDFNTADLIGTTKNYWIYWIKKYKTYPWKKLKFQS